MKRMIVRVLSLAMLLALLAGCASKPQEPASGDEGKTPAADVDSPADGEKIYRFALVSNGPITDGDWNENSPSFPLSETSFTDEFPTKSPPILPSASPLGGEIPGDFGAESCYFYSNSMVFL